jgi:hypothetical protein
MLQDRNHNLSDPWKPAPLLTGVLGFRIQKYTLAKMAMSDMLWCIPSFINKSDDARKFLHFKEPRPEGQKIHTCVHFHTRNSSSKDGVYIYTKQVPRLAWSVHHWIPSGPTLHTRCPLQIAFVRTFFLLIEHLTPTARNCDLTHLVVMGCTNTWWSLTANFRHLVLNSILRMMFQTRISSIQHGWKETGAIFHPFKSSCSKVLYYKTGSSNNTPRKWPHPSIP